jgi:hypothetical protein
MKTLVTFLLVMISAANFAYVTPLTKSIVAQSNDDSKPKRPPISDDGPIWPPVPLQ